MADSDIVLKNLTKARLRRLLNMFCVHANELHAGYYVCYWETCDACILRDIPWQAKEYGKVNDIVKDLCFAIWHEDILNA